MTGEKTQDLVALWEVHLADGIHMIEFEHGTTSGRRVLRVDREVIVKRDWMFKLVGNESFHIGKSKAQCSIKIEPIGGFAYEYSLEVIFAYEYNLEVIFAYEYSLEVKFAHEYN